MIAPQISASHMMTAERARRDMLWCLAWLLLLLLWETSRWDLAVVRAVATGSGFALRDHWFTSTVLHQGGRAAGWLVMAALVLNLWRPLPFARDLSMSERRWWLGSIVACLLAVLTIKHASLTSCPWSLAEFGGTARYVPHWRLGVADGGGGGCFPSGHASAGFSFFAGYFALRERHGTAARWWLAGVLFFGVIFGVGQTLRGAHYPSHTLWTAWICLAICVTLHHAGWVWRGRTA